MPETNAEQQAYWNAHGGVWVAQQERLDRQIATHGERAIAALAARPGERVLDLGCGCGDTSLVLARAVAPGGEVLGLDLSEPMLARARERAAAAGLANLHLRAADVQTVALPPASFDAAFSRFGVMFFADPPSAFENIRAALRPGGRLAFVCWRTAAENDWVRIPTLAVAPFVALPPPPAEGAPGPFSFGDAERVRRILAAAGFADIQIEAVNLPMAPGGGDLDDAASLFLEIGPVAAVLREQGAPPELREKARIAVRASFAPHLKAGRVELGSAVWLVQARRGL